MTIVLAVYSSNITPSLFFLHCNCNHQIVLLHQPNGTNKNDMLDLKF